MISVFISAMAVLAFGGISKNAFFFVTGIALAAIVEIVVMFEKRWLWFIPSISLCALLFAHALHLHFQYGQYVSSYAVLAVVIVMISVRLLLRFIQPAPQTNKDTRTPAENSAGVLV